ncbi:MAG: HAD family phosphatase [Lachnospiraceae bacterium]|nr:HAD family phosphatase [Lachnospiraceae bacterium]
MIKNVIFDIGNVLCNYAWPEFFFERTGGDRVMVERLAAATVNHETWPAWDIGNLSYSGLIEMMCKNDPEIADVIRDVFRDIKGLLTPRDYALPWIEKLQAAGYFVYYLSNMSRPAIEQCPEAMYFIPYTDGGILSFRFHHVKPAPDIYHLLEKRYHLIPKECVFIDDSEMNIETAKNLGWHGIVFTDHAQAEDELKALGVIY